MRISNLHIPLLKDNPSDASIISHRLMLKSGMMRQIASGMYTLLPLGVRVMNKVMNIIKDELNDIGASEVIFPILQNNDVWVRSGREKGYCGPETLRMKDRNGNDMLFSPTAEESAHLIFEMDVKSYKQLPVSFYQMNWKFRDEIRPRFGLMRAREFIMLDAYSFDLDENAAQKTYNDYFTAYLKVFKRMGLVVVPMRAATGEIGGDLSHEFHVIADNGESGIFYDKKLDDMRSNLLDYDISEIQNIYAKTDDEHNPDNCPVSTENLAKRRGIEVGHIFYYADKYTKKMDIKIQNAEGLLVNPVGGCYGIGITRLIAASIEASYDDKGIIWHDSIAPFKLHLVNLSPKDQKATLECEKLYSELLTAKIDVLYDDSENSIGQKLNSADLIGIPRQIIIGAKNISNDQVEIKERKTGNIQTVKLDQLPNFLAKMNV